MVKRPCYLQQQNNNHLRYNDSFPILEDNHAIHGTRNNDGIYNYHLQLPDHGDVGHPPLQPSSRLSASFAACANYSDYRSVVVGDEGVYLVDEIGIETHCKAPGDDLYSCDDGCSAPEKNKVSASKQAELERGLRLRSESGVLQPTTMERTPL